MPSDQLTTLPKHILVVDDDPAIRGMLTLQLEMAGYTVTSACTGLEALDTLVACVPALVILDLGLPDISGYEVLDRLEKLEWLPRYPVLIMTAMDVSWSHLEGLGVQGYLSKPYHRVDLLGKIEELLRKEEVAQQALESRG